MEENLGEVHGPMSPSTVLLIILALQFFDVLLEKVKKRGSTSNEEVKIRQDIKQLLMEASSLSTPSTFAQSAKLRRAAAAKEKELKKKQAENSVDKKWAIYEQALLASKVLFYAGFCWQFWSTPVASVPAHLLQPFGRVLAWRGKDASTGGNNTLAGANISSQQILIAKAFQEISTLSFSSFEEFRRFWR